MSGEEDRIVGLSRGKDRGVDLTSASSVYILLTFGFIGLYPALSMLSIMPMGVNVGIYLQMIFFFFQIINIHLLFVFSYNHKLLQIATPGCDLSTLRSIDRSLDKRVP